MRSRKLTPEEISLWQKTIAGASRLIVDSPPATSNPKIVVNIPVVTDRTIDLHGMSVAEAYNKVLSTLDHWYGNAKYIFFITGQSGIIKNEFPHWLVGHIAVRRLEPISGGGAFKVYLCKKTL